MSARRERRRNEVKKHPYQYPGTINKHSDRTMYEYIQDVKRMIAVIVAAIKKRHAIETRYRDARRWVEPCCLGTGEDSRWLLWGWQVNRYSGWRLFRVEEFLELRDTGEVVQGQRCGFDYSHPDMTSIHARMYPPVYHQGETY